jgi:hypothetical protein
MKVKPGLVSGEVGSRYSLLNVWCTIGRTFTCGGFEQEHIDNDPKGCELCLDRAKPGEILVEARSDTDVQIVRLIWV